MKIGILGGTFDPIHKGHLALASHAKEQFDLDKILFIPAFIPPHKAARRDLTPAPYRYRMVEIAISKEPGFEVSPLELNRPDISYTVETLHALKKEFPHAELYLILGADSLAEISNWRDPEEIKRNAHLLIAPRPGAKEQAVSSGVAWINMPLCSFSSSVIRQRIERGEAVDSMLPPGILDYIHKMGLYFKGVHGTSAA